MVIHVHLKECLSMLCMPSLNPLDHFPTLIISKPKKVCKCLAYKSYIADTTEAKSQKVPGTGEIFTIMLPLPVTTFFTSKGNYP